MMKFCPLWLSVLADLFRFLVLSLRSESSLAAENLFLRKQLGFHQERKIKPRRTSHPAQVTLLLLSRWFNWRSALTVVTPRTFIAWQRKRYQLFWREKCQAGRPRIPPDLQRLIRTMARENPTWGQERIANELLVKLGLRVSPRTIRKYLPESPGARGGNRRRDQRWSTFLKNHAAAIIACDFLRRSECQLSNLLRASGHGTCFTPNHSPQRDCPSDCGLDPPTAARGDSLRSHVPVYPA